jgi:hypothetical protein
MAPIIALAQVMEWRVNLYPRFSSLYGPGGNDEIRQLTYRPRYTSVSGAKAAQANQKWLP